MHKVYRYVLPWFHPKNTEMGVNKHFEAKRAKIQTYVLSKQVHMLTPIDCATLLHVKSIILHGPPNITTKATSVSR